MMLSLNGPLCLVMLGLFQQLCIGQLPACVWLCQAHGCSLLCITGCKVCFPTIVRMEVGHCELISRQDFVKADNFVGL